MGSFEYTYNVVQIIVILIKMKNRHIHVCWRYLLFRKNTPLLLFLVRPSNKTSIKIVDINHVIFIIIFVIIFISIVIIVIIITVIVTVVIIIIMIIFVIIVNNIVVIIVIIITVLIIVLLLLLLLLIIIIYIDITIGIVPLMTFSVTKNTPLTTLFVLLKVITNIRCISKHVSFSEYFLNTFKNCFR